jgi:hypothetical protein
MTQPGRPTDRFRLRADDGEGRAVTVRQADQPAGKHRLASATTSLCPGFLLTKAWQRWNRSSEQECSSSLSRLLVALQDDDCRRRVNPWLLFLSALTNQQLTSHVRSSSPKREQTRALPIPSYLAATVKLAQKVADSDGSRQSLSGIFRFRGNARDRVQCHS